MNRRIVFLGIFVALFAFVAWSPATASPLGEAVAGVRASDPVAMPTLSVDPLLDAVIVSTVFPAEKCNDFGQCAGQPNYTPCDTPQGCVCYNPPGPAPSSCGRP